ncbi:transporter substrate-binding domain-containing protein [Chromobacterium sphagni]|uniref:Amino acid ABC transporter n=1 Tax=Chromobacterium sphagni TaxID=1903179 RepID=A0A1S1WYR5_9NEIS|nr:transporter substrate-binding domain-containing protein [Chromobacterium sphagni]OHX12198.1 amino acid ABC transporter [Chromobacterium sphagni]OHX21717.1 amino acid ABC transporter [Chromobacterium sphagni]
MTRRRFLLASLVASCALAGQTAGADQLDNILQRGELRVGTTGDYLPFSGKDPASGRYQGLDIDLAEDLARALGVRLRLVPTSWPALMRDQAADKFDIAMSGISVSLERQKRALYSIPYLNDGKTPIARCENQRRFQTLAQINQPGVKLAVNPGGTNERFARTNLPQAELTVFPDNTRIFQQIIDGKADLMVTDAVETRYQQKLHPALCAIHPERPFDFSQKAYLLPNDWRWKAWVDQWLSQRLQDGGFARLSAQWLGQ